MINVIQENIQKIPLCGGLTLAGCQVANKPLYDSLFSRMQGEKNTTRSSWVEVRTGRSFSNCHLGQSRLDLEKLI